MKLSPRILLTLALFIGATSGCSELTQPTPPEVVPPLLNYADLAGDYDVTMSVSNFDSAWDDFTGHRFIAVLTMNRSSSSTSTLAVGSFTDFDLLNAAGERQLFSPLSGSVTREMDSAGRLVLSLGSRYRVLIVGSISNPDGAGLGPPRFEGTFEVGGHISGPFVAKRRIP